MGWHGSALQVGSAVGAPLAGVGIDLVGAWSGFAVVGLLAASVSVVGLAAVPRARRSGRGVVVLQE
jgi:predicted MFS family arabinose efflux permease